MQAFFKILMGYRPPLPPDMPPGYRSVMTSCWSTNPDDRPGFEVVISSLQVRRSQPTCGPLRDVALCVLWCTLTHRTLLLCQIPMQIKVACQVSASFCPT